MKPRFLILGLAGTALLIAVGSSWRASRAGEHRLPASEGIPSTAGMARPTQTFVSAGRPRPARRVVAETQPELDSALARFADVNSLGDAEERLAAVETWVGELPPAQFRFALERFSDADRAGLVGQLLVRRWTDLDPLAAADWTEQLAKTEPGGALQAAVALAWAETDLPASLTWARALPDGNAREHVLTELGYETARQDPVQALQLAVELSPTAERDALILHGARQWAAADAGAARTWLLQWPESELQHHALADFAMVLAGQDGDAGARFAIEHPAAGLSFERAIIGVIERWSQYDLPAAQAWIETFPESPLRDQAVQVAAYFSSH